VAVAHLVAEGMELIERNWRCSRGEIDAILRDSAGVLVFCEVKTRRSTRFGEPIEAVVGAKSRRLRKLAAIWLADRDIHAPEIRFDVVSVLPQPAGAARVEHVRNAF
jgi:putative endonuclease